MPSVRYFNQSAPFWDFVANLESSGMEHPFFGAFTAPRSNDRDGTPSGPHHGEETTAAPSGATPPQVHPDAGTAPHHSNEAKSPTGNNESHPSRHSPPWNSFQGCPRGRSHHGHAGFRDGFPHRGFWGGRGRHHGGRGGFPFGGPQSFDLSEIAQFFGQHLGVDGTSFDKVNKEHEGDGGNSKDFTPPADVFDTEDAYVIHVSLAGAKKEDIAVNYDMEKSEVGISGVVTRPGAEDFVKTLAMDERHVGIFERKIRLGSRVHPAVVEVEAISAKMEDGILMITVPKVDREYVEVTKVDIE